MFSKAFGYALRALVYIHRKSKQGGKVGLAEVADALAIPKPFLGKILQDLVRHNLLASVSGRNGGFSSHEKTGNTKLVELLQITDGTLVLERCVLGVNHCDPHKPCLLHHDFVRCRHAMLEQFATKTIDELSTQVDMQFVWE